MTMLKLDFHAHAGTDIMHKVSYSPKQLIDHYAKLKYDVFSITGHGVVIFSKELKDYAKRKGILLIPGTEKMIEGKEVILGNVTNEQIKNLKTFEKLEKLKDENILVHAPHPFYPTKECLKEKLIENIKLFDSIEYCHFYLKHINHFNKKAVETATKYKKAIVGTSDTHMLSQAGTTYTLVDANKEIDSVFEAIRKRKTELKTKPLSIVKASWVMANLMFRY